MPVAASVAAASDSEEEDDGQEPGARVDGRRQNRGRKARSTILLAEKLRWIGRVEAQLLLTPAPAHSHSLKDGRLARAVRATLEAHDKPWVIGEAGRVGKDGRGGQGALRGGAEHYKWTRAILRWLKQAPLLRAQDRRHKLCQVRSSSAAAERVKHKDAEDALNAEVDERSQRGRFVSARWLSHRMRQLALAACAPSQSAS